MSYQNPPLRRKLREAKLDVNQAVENGVLRAEEAEELRRAEELLEQVVAVDDFAPAELASHSARGLPI